MSDEKHILIIVTAHAVFGQTGEKTGLWFEELSTPYYAFIDHGARVDLVSLPGGPVPIDPRSLATEGRNPASVERFLKDQAAMDQLLNSRKLSDVSVEDYQAVFIPGGHGAMWDLAASRELGDFLSAAWAGGAVLASVCHGPAGLVNARDSQGRPLVAGRKVGAFSNSEEAQMKLSEVVPFLLETRLRQLGADYQSGPDFEPFVVRDGRLITGQNPASSKKVADLLLEALDEQ